MPTELGPPFPVDLQGIPPHMSTEDFSIWLLYQRTIPRDAQRLYFDVRLGADDKMNAHSDPAIARMWWANNAKRADVLIEFPDRLEMIELRTNALPNAVGRLLTYRMLWNDDPAIAKPLTMTLVTDHQDRDVERLCAANQIGYTVLPRYV